MLRGGDAAKCSSCGPCSPTELLQKLLHHDQILSLGSQELWKAKGGSALHVSACSACVRAALLRGYLIVLTVADILKESMGRARREDCSCR